MLNMKKLTSYLPIAILLVIFFTSANAKNLTISADSLSTTAKTETNTHSAFDNLLKKYVSIQGKVNYQGFLKDKTKLQAYLKSLESIKVSKLNKNEQLAFWINVYNASTIDQILRNYPIKSIKDIADGKVWDKALPYKFNGKALTLNDIEHHKLLQTFNDPRIHFAINCAAKSCPKLSNRAFTAENVQHQLSTNTSAFLNNSDQNIISKDKIELSQLFNWFKADFIKANGSVIAFINKFSKQKISNKQDITFIEYNWDLNSK
jgi:hypothetical protein